MKRKPGRPRKKRAYTKRAAFWTNGTPAAKRRASVRANGKAELPRVTVEIDNKPEEMPPGTYGVSIAGARILPGNCLHVTLHLSAL